ncbi:MAG: zinc ribbon domain-containing protein [Candidatus Moranbacteria bacterium]|nr:zinc ribbon domain-containing protein [Candidatus Moranbacteria bacterium]
MEKVFTQCQSCGMPLKHDVQGGGSEKDGTRSTMYCSSCYQDGVFTQPEISVEEMQRLVDDVLKNEMKWWRPLRWFAVRQIPTLLRWKREA